MIHHTIPPRGYLGRVIAAITSSSLHEAGASYAAIARAAGLSKSRVHQVCQSYAYQLHRRSEDVTGGEPFMERLRRARALLGAADRVGGMILNPRFEPHYP